MSERTAVVMPVYNETKAIEQGLVENVLGVINPEEGGNNFLVMNVAGSSPDFVDMVEGIAREKPNLKILNQAIPADATFAITYLHGFQRALHEEGGVDLVVEMDGNGGHPHEDIEKHIEALNDYDAVFSSRFSRGGGIHQYSAKRRATSVIGTVAANAIFFKDTHKLLPDFTSGFESFHAEVLDGILCKFPPQEWVSVAHGPGHLYQTEMRLKVMMQGHRVGIVPMIWGEHRADPPKELSNSTISQAAKGLYELYRRRGEFRS